jgi:hypothetical protein
MKTVSPSASEELLARREMPEAKAVQRIATNTMTQRRGLASGLEGLQREEEKKFRDTRLPPD